MGLLLSRSHLHGENSSPQKSGTWNLFALDDRKSNRSVRISLPNVSSKKSTEIKLILLTGKGYYTISILVEALTGKFSICVPYAASLLRILDA